MQNNDPNFGPGESFDGNPFGKPGQDFRDSQRKVDAAAEKETAERLERLKAAAGISDTPPPAPEPMDELPAKNGTATCSCAVQ
jgi:hypothetical protein